MRIAQVVSTPPFAWASGGCARVVYELSRDIARRGHDVAVLTTDLHGPEGIHSRIRRDESSIDGIRILRFRCASRLLAWKYKIYLSPCLISYLKNHLREYDVVHLHDLLSLHAVATARYCEEFEIPYVLTTHGSISWLEEGGWLNRFYDRMFARRILMNASKVLSLSITESQASRRLGVEEGRNVIIPNGIRPAEYADLPERGEFRKNYSIETDESVILYVGRIHKTKGIKLLVKSFHELSRRVPRSRLVIVGPDDGYGSAVGAMVRRFGLGEKVLFTGFLDERSKISALVDSDVFVTPRFLGFPITFLEACICGTPIVTTNDGDELDWIDDQVGFVVDFDAEQLTLAILRILEDQTLGRRFGAIGRKLASTVYCWDKISKDVLDVYESVLEGRMS